MHNHRIPTPSVITPPQLLEPNFPNLDQDTLHYFCLVANRVAYKFLGIRNSCVLTTAALCDVLKFYGIPAEPLRVEAWPYGFSEVILGSDGDGTRLPAAKKGNWHGHLVTIVAGRFLLDPTLDQATGASPFTGEVPPSFLEQKQTVWFVNGVCHTTFPGGEGPVIRYHSFPGRGGFKSAADFRQSRRDQLAIAILWQLYREQREMDRKGAM